MMGNDHLERVKKFHDLDSNHYKEQRYHSHSCEGLSYIKRKEIILKTIGSFSGRILDIGCGPGILTPHLLKRGFVVYSIDLSREMLKKARDGVFKFPETAAHFAVSEATNICFETGIFDAVLCIGVLYYLSGYQPLLDEIIRVLKKDGKAIIQVNKIRFPTLYKKFIPLYQTLKSKLTGKKYNNMNFKFNIFSYKEFLTDLELKGFFIEDIQCYDLRIPFLDLILPRISLSLGRFMFNHRNLPLFQWVAHGLLVTVRKRS